MNIAVVNSGVVHAKARTLAFGRCFETVDYIDVAGIDDPMDFKGTNITYHRFHYGRFGRISGYFAMHRLLRSIRPDGIVSHFASGPGFFSTVSYARCPVAAIAMGHDVLYDKGDGYVPKDQRFLTRYGLRLVDYVSAKSKVVRDRILTYGARELIDVNYWGVDTKVFKPIDREAARADLGLNNLRRIILSPRALEPRLNILLIVEAFNEIKDVFPDLTLILIGRSLESYKTRVLDYINKNNLNDRVKVYGACDAKRLNLFYNSSDVVVSMASSEGFPNSVLEAMACKKLVLVGEIEQTKELLMDRVNAIMCKIEKGQIVAGMTAIFGGEASARDRMTEEAYRTVLQHANIEDNAKRFAAHFEEVALRYRTLPWGTRVPKKIRKAIFTAIYFILVIVRKMF